MSIDPMTLAMIMGGSSALSGGLNALSGIFGSNAASTASQQTASAENAALMNIIGGQQSAASALQPYTTGGQANYNFLSYLLGGNAPSSTWTDADQAQMDQLNSYINNYGSTRGGQSGKYAAVLADAQSQLAQLQQQKNAGTATTQANQEITSSGLPQGYLTNIPTFSYDVNTDPNIATASKFANNTIAAQNTAAGNYGSGNMASAITQEIAGTLEPTYYNQSYQNYLANVVNPRTTVYNELTGNTGGSGQSAASTLAGDYTGSASTGSQYIAGAGNALSSGTLGSTNALTSALTNVGNNVSSAGGQYLNYNMLYNLFNQSQNNQATNPANLAANYNWANNTAANPYAWGGSMQDF
jgi:hypothetical protein